MKKTKAFQILSFDLPLYLIFFSSSLTLCLYINMRQLKHIGFICNIFNCLNEEKKKGSQILFLYFSLIYSYFFFILFGIMYLVDILMKKTKSFMYLILFLSPLALCLYLSVRQLNHMCFICNIFNCLNEKKQNVHKLSLYFLLLSLYISI
jgi:hypothetical protein